MLTIGDDRMYLIFESLQHSNSMHLAKDKKMKHHDKVYGKVELTDVLKDLINTQIFQRLLFTTYY